MRRDWNLTEDISELLDHIAEVEIQRDTALERVEELEAGLRVVSAHMKANEPHMREIQRQLDNALALLRHATETTA